MWRIRIMKDVYGKYENGKMEFAPNAVKYRGALVVNPGKEILAELGYRKVKDVPPEVDDRHYAVPTEAYELKDGCWFLVYEIREKPPADPTAPYDEAMEAHLAEERCARGYTTREPDSYWNSGVPRWRMDARDWSRHKDDVMMYALTVMNEVKAGTRPPPTLEEFKAGLPKIKWTEK